MLDDIKFKNEENKQTFILLKELMDLKEKMETTGTVASRLSYDKHLTFLFEKFNYIPLIHTKRYMKFSNYEDLLQEGKLGLLFALRNFDMKRSNNFYRLANQYVKTRVKRAANKFDVVNVPMEIAKKEPPVRVSITADTAMPADEVTPLQKIENIEKSRLIKRMICDMPVEHKKIVCLFYGIKIVKNEISSSGPRRNISYISDKLNMSRAKIKKVIDNTTSKINQL